MNEEKILLRAAKNIMKAAMKEPRDFLHGANYTDGVQYFCDSYRILSIPDGHHVPGFDHAPTEYDMSKHIPKYDYFDTAVLLPELTALKEYIRSEKARGAKRVLFDFGSGLPCIDAEYLMWMMEATEATVGRVCKGQGWRSWLVCESENGVRALVLPIKPADGVVRGRTL